jgi:hypothetical protein
MSWKELAGDASFAEWPHFRECFTILEKAFVAFHSECDEGEALGRDAGLAATYNALIRLQISSLVAVNVATGMNEIAARRKARREVRRRLVSSWPTREVSLLETRAIATVLAYRDGIRFSVSGKKDSRMDAALQAAALVEGLVSNDAVETVRKSITRLRKRVKGASLFRLNANLLQIEVVGAESVMLAGLPGQRGRPRTRK